MFKPSTIYSFLVFIALFSIGIYGNYSFNAADNQEQNLLLKELIGAQASSIERRLSRSLSATYILAQEIRRNGGEFKDFDKYASEVIQTLGGISNLQLAPKGIIKHIHPLRGNEKAIGHNLLKDDARSKDALLAIETKTLTLTGLYKLIQGGSALIGRNPVFLKKDGKEYFWGFASVMIRLEELLIGSELNQLTSRGYEYQLSRIHPDTSEVEIFAKSGGNLGDHSVYKSINVPNGFWGISISRNQTPQFFTGFGIAVSFLVAIMFAVLLNRILREPERLRLQVKLSEGCWRVCCQVTPLSNYISNFVPIAVPRRKASSGAPLGNVSTA